MFTVDTTSPHAVAVQAYDEYNDSVADTHHTLRSGTKQSTGVIENSIVRRLTPLECERLQGFPDGWTEGQPDTHRYKQMGNAVAVPVVEWIVQGICDTFDIAG
jgi:site-specific DNA-cytosine methylase